MHTLFLLTERLGRVFWRRGRKAQSRTCSCPEEERHSQGQTSWEGCFEGAARWWRWVRWGCCLGPSWEGPQRQGKRIEGRFKQRCWPSGSCCFGWYVYPTYAHLVNSTRNDIQVHHRPNSILWYPPNRGRKKTLSSSLTRLLPTLSSAIRTNLSMPSLSNTTSVPLPNLCVMLKSVRQQVVLQPLRTRSKRKLGTRLQAKRNPSPLLSPH